MTTTIHASKSTLKAFDACLGGRCFEYDNAIRWNAHFPGGRFDAVIQHDGSWRLTRMDFTRADEITASVPSGFVDVFVAEGTGAKSLADAVNPELDRLTNGAPVVNGPATYTLATDSHACTVVAIDRKGTRVTLRRDKATLLNGAFTGEPDALRFEPGGFVGHTSGTQRYAYEPDPNGETYVVTRRVRRNGEVVWKAVGHGTNSPGLRAHFRSRREHYDFNF